MSLFFPALEISYGTPKYLEKLRDRVSISDVMIPLFSGIGIRIDIRAEEKELESHGIGPEVESIPELESVPGWN